MSRFGARDPIFTRNEAITCVIVCCASRIVRALYDKVLCANFDEFLGIARALRTMKTSEMTSRLRPSNVN